MLATSYERHLLSTLSRRRGIGYSDFRMVAQNLLVRYTDLPFGWFTGTGGGRTTCVAPARHVRDQRTGGRAYAVTLRLISLTGPSH
jgi:hypothetical protein